jgi:F0F1-type ATP synthase assembly protein I
MTEADPPRPDEDPDEELPRRAVWFQYSEASSVGIEMVVSVVVCTVGAHYIERYLTHWSPWTTLIGVALGCMTAANAVVRAARTYQQSLRDQAKKDDHDRA